MLKLEAFSITMQIPSVCLLHGLGGSPNGSVYELERELEKLGQRRSYLRPSMPHGDPQIASVLPSVTHLAGLDLPLGSLVAGISLGGLVAARLQETERPDLHVVCINSPSWAGDVELERRMERRVSLYSSSDGVIAGRIAEWPLLAEAYDLPWLTGHDTDPHKRRLAAILNAYLESGRIAAELLAE